MTEKFVGIGKDSWIQYSFNRSYTNPFPEKDFSIKLEPKAPSAVVPWETACNNVAQDIYETYKNLYVAMSGGIDSENVANTFYRLKIPFKPIIFQAGDLHDIDSWWALKWCKDRKIEPIVIQHTIEEWIQNNMAVSKTHCSRFGAGWLTPLLKYVETRGGYLVTGSGFFEYFPDPNLDHLYKYPYLKDNNVVDEFGVITNTGYVINETDLLQHKIQRADYQHPYNFLSWTPEIVLSYISLRDMSKTSEENKSTIMNCVPRPKIGGVHHQFFRTYSSQVRQWVYIKSRIGKNETAYIGSADKLKHCLLTGTHI